MKKIIVIGGGPAGMMSAIVAAQNGHRVTLFEKKHKLGLKLGITGKGRCNITNNSSVKNHLENIVVNHKFMISPLTKFNPEMLINFLYKNGLQTKVERGNRIFPKSENALKVVQFFHQLLQQLKVNIFFQKIDKLIIENKTVIGVKTQNGESFFADSVIIATGGLSYPSTGSTGDGLIMLENAGHHIIKTRPALVPINIKNPLFGKANYFHLRNVKVTLKQKKKTVFSEIGEIDFHHFGLAGALAFTCSSFIKKDLSKYKIIIDFKPGLNRQKLENRILRDLQNDKIIGKALKLFPSIFQNSVLDFLQIDYNHPSNQFTKKMRNRLINFLKEFTVKPAGFRGYNEAIITRGGISTKEIDSSTMQSKLINHLSIVGEMLDVDALTGGYNLQIAFSTGFVAGNNC